MLQNYHGSILSKWPFWAIEEEDLIVEVSGTTYGWEVGHGNEPPITAHLLWWGVVEDPATWDIVVKFLCEFFALINDDIGYTVPIDPWDQV